MLWRSKAGPAVLLAGSKKLSLVEGDATWSRLEVWAWKQGQVLVPHIEEALLGGRDTPAIQALCEQDAVQTCELYAARSSWDVEEDGLDELDEQWIEKILAAVTEYSVRTSGGRSDLGWKFQQLLAEAVARTTNGLIALEMEEFDDRFWK